MKQYPKVVQEIHNAYMTAGDILLLEAEKVLSKKSDEKAERLVNLGFKKAIGVAEATKLASEKAEKEFLANMVYYYRTNYPNQKFITEEQVNKINKKYNLVCANIDRYKGFVPEEKITIIEKFRINHNDRTKGYIENIVFSFTSSDAEGIKEFRKYKGKVHQEMIHDNRYVDLRLIFPEKRFDGSFTWLLRMDRYEKISTEGLQICAPRKDMDLTGLKETKEGFFQKITRVECPDPLVLQPVKGGYLVIAAWGDEASDEIVVNHNFN